MPAALTSASSEPTAGTPARGGLIGWVAAYRWPLLAALLLVGGIVALGVATFRPDWIPGRAGEVARRAANSIGQGAADAGQTVASLFNIRSPGERAGGALASLKGPKRPRLHQRALPKVRGPVSPLAAIVAGPPVVPPITEAPLYNTVIGPKPSAPVALTPPPGGGSPIGPGVFPLPGGGGGIIIPPITTTPPDTPVVPVTPVTPTIPGVPEPGTWAMMLLGFAMVGAAVRRRAVARVVAA